jgi:hypothetical protein
MSYDPDESLEYTSASPETVIVHVHFIISVNLFHNAYKQKQQFHGIDFPGGKAAGASS